jgi:DNA-binding transcriptional LysR family regulator
MNVNDLEVFDQVVIHRGMANAARLMPHRVTESAVNKAIARLETVLGEMLFDRVPFRVTSRGEALFGFVHPFFAALAHFLAGDQRLVLRVAASDVVFNHYLDDIVMLLEQRGTSTKVRLRTGHQSQMHAWLRDGQADLVITPPIKPCGPDLESCELIKLPLLLAVPKKSAFITAEDVWKRMASEPLIVAGTSETIAEHFAIGLKMQGIAWDVAVDASSLNVVVAMVAAGRGIGLIVDEPSLAHRKEIRAIRLPDTFPAVPIAATWHRDATPCVPLLVKVLKERAARTWPKKA